MILSIVSTWKSERSSPASEVEGKDEIRRIDKPPCSRLELDQVHDINELEGVKVL